MAKNENDLPLEERGYLENLVKPYFTAVTVWLEQIHVGMKGSELYDLIDQYFQKKFIIGS